ncbi:KGG domain-containing protein [Mesorhizobium sp.]|uniref:KGG domain-containing protein n=1 Tax=Mesorhizobium sp. TaxID=1871066 RepID=UPI003458E32D
MRGRNSRNISSGTSVARRDCSYSRRPTSKGPGSRRTSLIPIPQPKEQVICPIKTEPTKSTSKAGQQSHKNRDDQRQRDEQQQAEDRNMGQERGGSGNFAEGRERASEAGRKGGQS